MTDSEGAAAAEPEATTRSPAAPVIRWITVDDIFEALRLGVADFRAIPTHGILFGLVYGVVGLILVRAASDAALLPLVFPLASGFALVGPFLAVGLYELSRRREQGLETHWWDALAVRRHASFGSILKLGALLVVLFGLWLWVANVLFVSIVGTVPSGIGGFLSALFTTEAGWTLIVVGNSIGFVFALVVFAVSAFSFPLIVDRDLSPAEAVATSVRAVISNPLPMALWAFCITAALVVGSLPLFLGLPVILPILGHATWHVYRRVIQP